MPDAAYMRQYRAENPEYAQRQREANRAYKLANRARCSERERLRKAQLRREQFVEHVDPLILLERDDGVCGICGRDVDPFNFQIDHVVPLSRGGEHSYANTQAAHASCNQRKYNKPEVLI